MQERVGGGGRRDILVNGVAAVTSAATLSDLLTELGFADARVATAINGNFVAASARARAPITPGDRIEIVSPRQGG